MPEINFQDKKISYRAGGAGEMVLLLHGFAEDGNIWNKQAEKLKEHHLVIVPDIPGSGKSELLDKECTMTDYAEVIKAIVDEEFKKNEKTTFTLIGHSMGGYISLAFAKKYSGLLNGLGLFHSSAFADDDQKKETRKKGIEFIKKNGAEAFLKTSIPNLFSEKTKQEKPELLEDLLNISKDISPAALIQYYEAMIRRPDTTEVLKSIPEPVLFIIGAHDTAVPLQSSLQQSHIPAISHLNILQNSGHVGMWEEETLSTSYLEKFLGNLTW